MLEFGDGKEFGDGEGTGTIGVQSLETTEETLQLVVCDWAKTNGRISGGVVRRVDGA